MDKVREYQRRADELREAEKAASPHLRAQLEGLAQTWERMAKQRKALMLDS